ncbi:MAG: translation initiation factor IF-2 [Clostridia bacterium]|nr:translation initiation factor IF-2 [Clostridia bacterium]
MSEINNEEKQQNINNIKALYKVNTDGEIPALFHEVKKAKQQIFAIANSLKERITFIKNEQVQTQKQFVEAETGIEVKENVSKVSKIKQQPQEEKSFAELFASTIEDKKPEQPAQPKLQAQQKPAVSNQTRLKTENKTQEQKPFVRREGFVAHDQKQNNPNFKPYQSNNYQNNNFNRQGQNQNAGQNYHKPFIANQNNGFNRQGGGQNGYQRPFNQNTQGQQNKFQRPYVNNNAQKQPYNAQNKSLMGIIPKKTNTLTSAATAFATKERDFSNKKKSTDRPNDDERRINKKSLLRRGLIEEHNIEERMVTRKLKLKRTKVEAAPIVSAPITNAVITTSNLTVKILSEKIGKPVTEIIKQLMLLGIMTTINSSIDFTTAELVANELGVTLELKVEKSYEEKLKENAVIDDGTNNEKRPPIVTIVGHVDHGKTSLLDYIRKTHVTSREAGGITQAIGAYSINWNGEDITFIDTPGHEAFINMRKRGTEITDVAVLIVAADDGIKPQTVEAIKHVKEAKVPMIVAITKIDKQETNIERIKQQLTEYEVLPEEWGGDTIIVPVSSVTGEGVNKLLEMILLVAEMQTLKCNKKRAAVGTVIEAQLDKNKGPIANVIVQNGTLKIGDCVVSGFAVGKIRAMTNDKGKSIIKAGPSTPVSIMGLDSVAISGDSFQVVDEKFSKAVIEERKIKMAQAKIESGMPKSLDEFLATPVEEAKKTLSLIIKASSQGSVEALKQSLLEIKNDEVKVEVVSSGVGNVTENDIQLAKVSNATIVAFDTKVLAKISNFAKQNKIEIKEYNIIYKAIEEIEKLLKTMMAPKYTERVVGHAEVRALFKISSVGTIAGCYVLDGKVVRNAEVKITRKDAVIHEGKIATLKREKDDAKEVAAGYECGIKIDGFNDIQEGDIIECILKEQISV